MTYYRDADYELADKRIDYWVEQLTTEFTVPEHTAYSLARYVVLAATPGSFVKAVLCNDLHEAINRADDINRFALADIVAAVWNVLPGDCHGDEKTVSRYNGEEVEDA